MRKITQKTVPSLLRRVFALGLASGGLLASGVWAPAASALSETEVVQQLASVPVFIVATTEGAYVTNRLTAEDGSGQIALLYVFFNGDDAESYLRQAREQNANFAANAVVGWVELAALYAQAQTDAEIPLRLLFVPESEEVTAAAATDADFDGGVPLFIPKFSRDDSYVLLPIGNLNDGEPVVPVFFSQADIDGMLSALGESDPELRSQIEVEVLSLEGLIQQLRTTNDDNLTRLQLLPDSEAINYIREAQSGS